MWFLIHVLIIFPSVYASVDIPFVFPKCCPESQFLVNTVDALETSDKFKCIDGLFIARKWNISVSPLVLGVNVEVKAGFPEQCDDFVMSKALTDAKHSSEDYCYDNLISEVENGTYKKIAPRLISLRCRFEKNYKYGRFDLFQIRKCCPEGEVYSLKKRRCIAYIQDNSIFENIDPEGVAVFEVDIGLQCRTEEYTIDISNDLHSVKIDGSILTVKRRNSGKSETSFAKGEWCVERSAELANGLVARVCSQQCLGLASFCLRKCCPAGQHFQPSVCGRPKSSCVPDFDDATALNMTYYLRDNHQDYSFDTMGFRSILQCEHGRYALNRSIPDEAHYLSTSGHMVLPPILGGQTNDYCIESFDHRPCGGGVKVETLTCFLPVNEIKKNFTISFVMNTISCLFLALTLMVYLVLPELQNLHGRTLVCHVVTMLFAFCCLARVQYGLVEDERLCRFLGYGIYFGFVAAFCWLNVMCFDIWWTFGSMRTVQGMRKAGAERRRFLWYSLFAWSSSILLTLTMLLLDLFPLSSMLDANIGQGICWFGSLQNSATDWPHYIFFVIPMGVVVCTNFVLWVLTARHCNRVKSEVHRMQAGSTGDRTKKKFRADRARYVLTVKLWVVMGAGWVWELLSTLFSEPAWLWSTLDHINELQGLSIFLILVMKPKVYFLVRKKLGLDKEPKNKSSTSTTARTSSTFLSRSISNDEKTRIYPNGAGADKKC